MTIERSMECVEVAMSRKRLSTELFDGIMSGALSGLTSSHD